MMTFSNWAIFCLVALALLQSTYACKQSQTSEGENEFNETIILTNGGNATARSFEIIIQRDSPVESPSTTPSGQHSDNWDSGSVIDYFTKCLVRYSSELSNGMSSMYVNFVVAHDVWFTATKLNCRSSPDIASCWKESANDLVEKDSVYYRPFKKCLDIYFSDKEEPTHTQKFSTFGFCSPTKNNALYRPQPVVKCDNRFDFSTCMTAEQNKDQYYCDHTGQRRKFNFKILKKFINYDRCKCKYKRRDKKYDIKCQGREDEPEVNNNYEYFTLFYPYNSNMPSYYPRYRDFPSNPFLDSFHYPFRSSNSFDDFRYQQLPTCFASELPEILKSDSYLQDVMRKCIERQKTRNQTYKGIVGSCEPGSRWTYWFDESNPIKNQGSEKETIPFYRHKYRGNFRSMKICENPSAIQCKTSYGQSYETTGDYVFISPSSGLTCACDGETKCKNYKVRFCCPDNK